MPHGRRFGHACRNDTGVLAERSGTGENSAFSPSPQQPNMSALLAELFGTAILIILGDGVVANVLLQRSKGYNSGWIVIAAGWAFAVTIAVYCVTSISGAHLNPAVTIALASIGTFPWAKVPGYIV